MRAARMRPTLEGAWEGVEWEQAGTLELTHFRPEGSAHRPRTSAKLLYDDQGLFGMFRVEDRYVRCVRTGYMAPVYKDSCVEFFVQPGPGKGYFNFEFNCGGALLCSYITAPVRVPGGFREFTGLSGEECRQVAVYHSMPAIVDPEIAGPVAWALEFFVPFPLLEKYAGPFGRVRGREWRANFYKCADETSHPHWASWSPVDELNFHLPRCFGTLEFR